jgi:hypothetical protein
MLASVAGNHIGKFVSVLCSLNSHNRLNPLRHQWPQVEIIDSLSVASPTFCVMQLRHSCLPSLAPSGKLALADHITISASVRLQFTLQQLSSPAHGPLVNFGQVKLSVNGNRADRPPAQLH